MSYGGLSCYIVVNLLYRDRKTGYCRAQGSSFVSHARVCSGRLVCNTKIAIAGYDTTKCCERKRKCRQSWHMYVTGRMMQFLAGLSHDWAVPARIAWTRTSRTSRNSPTTPYHGPLPLSANHLLLPPTYDTVAFSCCHYLRTFF